MKQGFTLIELLAVIVVLAIIALIAVPVVLNIINEAKESSLLRSAEFYLDAVDYTIANAFLYHGGLTDGRYPITLNGDICKTSLPCDDENILKVEVSGDKPTDGYIELNGGVISNTLLLLGEKRIILDNEDNLAYDPNVCTLISGNKTILGSKYMCEVGPGINHNFYVLSQESNGTTNLIMDRNICEDGSLAGETNTCLVFWDDSLDNQNGPISLIEYLNNATSNWSNIPNLNITYDDEGENFTDFNVTGKARLPYLSEVKSYDFDTKNNAFLYDYLTKYNDIQKNTINGIDGYWTFSTVESYAEKAYKVYNSGGYGETMIIDELAGARPVINIKL